jgi:nucleoside-diphosphate-sugar epimerase
MTNPLRRVVLIGAAGTVGSHILTALLEDDCFHVTILTRPDSKATFSTQRNITIQRCEYTVPNLVPVFRNADGVICAIAVQQIRVQAILLEAAEKAGVKRFILDEFANSPTNQVGLAELRNFGPVVTKQSMVELAKSLSVSNPAFTWSALATGNFIDHSIIKYPAFGFDIANQKARLVDDGSEPISASTLRDIGLAVRGILRRPAETANRYLHIRSTQVSQREILNALETLTGKEYEVKFVSSKELYESGKEMFAKGERLGMLNLLVCQLFEKGAGRSIVVSRETSDNELLGVQEKDVEELVTDVLSQMGLHEPLRRT